jgi:hypothetical protein
MTHRTSRGVIRYTSKKPERMDQERGREYFTLTHQADEVDVLHAHCEIDDEPNVVRDVVMAMRSQDASPLDCSVRLTVGDRFEGSGWMRFCDGYAECESFNQGDGRIRQRVDTPGELQSGGWPHPPKGGHARPGPLAAVAPHCRRRAADEAVRSFPRSGENVFQ